MELVFNLCFNNCNHLIPIVHFLSNGCSRLKDMELHCAWFTYQFQSLSLQLPQGSTLDIGYFFFFENFITYIQFLGYSYRFPQSCPRYEGNGGIQFAGSFTKYMVQLLKFWEQEESIFPASSILHTLCRQLLIWKRGIEMIRFLNPCSAYQNKLLGVHCVKE